MKTSFFRFAILIIVLSFFFAPIACDTFAITITPVADKQEKLPGSGSLAVQFKTDVRTVSTGGANTAFSCDPVVAFSGTATINVDYTVTNVDTSPQTSLSRKAFKINIASDSLVEGTETVTMTLSCNNANAIVADPAVTTFNIIDNPPAANVQGGLINITAVVPSPMPYPPGGSTVVLTLYGSQFPSTMGFFDPIVNISNTRQCIVNNVKSGPPVAVLCSFTSDGMMWGSRLEVSLATTAPAGAATSSFTISAPTVSVSRVTPSSASANFTDSLTLTLSGKNFVNLPISVSLVNPAAGTLPCADVVILSPSILACNVSGPPDLFIGPSLDVVIVDGAAAAKQFAGLFRFLTAVCTGPCVGNSQCSVSGLCVCSPGWTGDPAAGCPIPSFSATLAPGSTPSEDGGVGLLIVSLAKKPSVPVVVKVKANDPSTGTASSEVSLTPPLLSFTAAAFDVPQTVTVSGVPDIVRDGPVPVEIVFDPLAAKGDPSYDQYRPAPLVTECRDSAPVIATAYPQTVPIKGHGPAQNMTLVGTHWDVEGSITFSVRSTSSGVELPVTILAYYRGQDIVANGIVRRARRALQTSDNLPSSAVVSLPGGTGYADLIATGTNKFVGPAMIKAVYYTDVCATPGMWGSGASCQKCPAGAVCPGGDRLWPLPGYWVPSETSPPDSLVRCDPPLERCLGASIAPCGAQSCLAGPVSPCSPQGYTGPRCATCTKGWYKFGERCVPCPSQWSTLSFLAADVLNWIAMAAAVLTLQTKENLGLVVAFSLSLQAVNGVGKMLSPFLPRWAQMLYRALGLFGGDITYLVPACAPFPFPFHVLFFCQLAYSLILPTPMFAFLLVARYLARRRLSKPEDALKRKERTLHYQYRIKRALFVMGAMIYLPVTTICFKALFCKEVAKGQWYLQADPSYKCFSSAHLAAFIAGALVVLGYSLACPPLLYWFLERNRTLRFADVLFRAQFDFNYEPFQNKYWWFFGSEFIISLGLALGDSKLDTSKGGNALVQLIVLGSLFLGHIVAIAVLRPYHRLWENGLAAILSFVNLASVLVLYLLGGRILDGSSASACAVCILAILLLAVGVNLYALVHHLFFISTPSDQKFPILREIEDIEKRARAESVMGLVSDVDLRKRFDLASRRKSFAVAQEKGLDTPFDAPEREVDTQPSPAVPVADKGMFELFVEYFFPPPPPLSENVR